MDNNRTTATLVLLLIAVSVGGGSMLISNNQQQVVYAALYSDYEDLMVDYNALADNYTDLESDYSILSDSWDSLFLSYLDLNQDYDELSSNYTALQNAYEDLQAAYASLLLDYAVLESAYNTVIAWIGGQILPMQMGTFAEAVRRYYFNDFYSDGWSGFARFCRDVIMHDSWTHSEVVGSTYYNPFAEVSAAFGAALRYDADSVRTSHYTKYFPLWNAGQAYYWGDWGLSGVPFTDITDIVHECCDMIEYEYDSAITTLQTSFSGDYVKFPVETLFRQAADCEDQAILVAAYLESCGFESMMVVIHDPEWEGVGLYHGVAMVWWDNDWPGSVPQFGLSFAADGPKYNNGWWLFLDTTWDTEFGTSPSWLNWYLSEGGGWFNYDIFTYAVCDEGGWVS